MAEEASPETKAQARKAFEKGMGFYQKDEFDKAIEQFDAGFRLIPNPLFLYNIAQAHRLSNRAEKALDYYRRYLKDSPDAKNKGEVEERIAALEKQLAATPKVELMVPSDARPDGPEPAPSALAQAQVSDRDRDIENKSPRSPSRKWLIIGGVVGGAVIVGLAVGLGVYFGTRPSPATVFEPVTP